VLDEKVDDRVELGVDVHHSDHQRPNVLFVGRLHGGIVAQVESVRKMTAPDVPLLIVVTGPPAAGKTTVARELAARLRLPLIAKDTIKEALFDALGVGDLAWSRRLGEATYLALAALAEDSVAAGGSLVLEGNFVRGSEVETRLAALPARIVQIHCSAPLELLIERYEGRGRHPGHIDHDRADALREAVEMRRHDPLDLPGETIRIDTTEPVDVPALADRLGLERAGVARRF
jgi:predicted kinase